jgi:predicted NBD/HSP70 family sugar kinase
LACVVVGVPAPFEPGTGVVTGPLPEEVRAVVPVLPEIFRCVPADPAPLVTERLGVPVAAENDAHLGALGEATFGAGRGLAHFVYVKLVEGLGAGLILDGKLYRGARNLAGELAHVQVRDDGPWCACGGRGCLAQSFGGFVTGFLDAAYPGPITFRDVLRLSAAGEAGTRRILHDVGRRVGRVLADACVLLNPEAIVVDGMLGAAAEPVLQGIREMVDRHAMSPVARAVRVVPGQLADRAELLGAVALATQQGLTDPTHRTDPSHRTDASHRDTRAT